MTEILTGHQRDLLRFLAGDDTTTPVIRPSSYEALQQMALIVRDPETAKYQVTEHGWRALALLHGNE